MEGRAALCFPRDSGWFQGYFVCDASRTQLGLMGEELPVDDCVHCPDGGYQEYRVTVIDFAAEKELELVVRKTGGELCRLEGDGMQFHPEMLLTDEKALEAVEQYFPSIAEKVEHNTTILQDCTVCFGQMEMAGLVFPES